MKITIHLNGQRKELDDGATIADVLRTLATKPALLAVERNKAIVPKSAHATTVIEDGDRIEIVTFVGGG